MEKLWEAQRDIATDEYIPKDKKTVDCDTSSNINNQKSYKDAEGDFFNLSQVDANEGSYQEDI